AIAERGTDRSVEPALRSSERVALVDFDPAVVGELFPQQRGEPPIELDGDEAPRARRKTPRQPSGAGADLHDALVPRERRVARDRVEEIAVDEEVLPERAARSEPRRRETLPERREVFPVCGVGSIHAAARDGTRGGARARGPPGAAADSPASS